MSPRSDRIGKIQSVNAFSDAGLHHPVEARILQEPQDVTAAGWADGGAGVRLGESLTGRCARES